MQRYGIAVLLGLFVLFASMLTYAHESLVDLRLVEKDTERAMMVDVLTNLETRVATVDNLLTVIRRKVMFIAFELPVTGNDDELNVFLHYLRSGFDREIRDVKIVLTEFELDIQELKKSLEQQSDK